MAGFGKQKCRTENVSEEKPDHCGKLPHSGEKELMIKNTK